MLNILCKKPRYDRSDEVYQEITERRAHFNPQRTDILSVLMWARDENKEHLSDQELRDELITLLFAGHETTATAIAWCLYWVHRLPQVREKLLAELKSLGENPNSIEIIKLPYLTAICHETMRLTPVAMLTFPRVVQESTQLLGYTLEPGTILIGCIYATHQRDDIYANPQEFNPERFIQHKYSPYEFIPFGNGARRCLGDALAQFEMKLVLSTILTNYRLKLADNKLEKLQRRGFLLTDAHGVNMI